MKRVRSLLDNSLEIAILFARLYALVALVGTVGALLAYVWTGDERWSITVPITAVTGGAMLWLGFVVYGNPEWRRGAADDRSA